MAPPGHQKKQGKAAAKVVAKTTVKKPVPKKRHGQR